MCLFKFFDRRTVVHFGHIIFFFFFFTFFNMIKQMFFKRSDLIDLIDLFVAFSTTEWTFPKWKLKNKYIQCWIVPALNILVFQFTFWESPLCWGLPVYFRCFHLLLWLCLLVVTYTKSLLWIEYGIGMSMDH